MEQLGKQRTGTIEIGNKFIVTREMSDSQLIIEQQNQFIHNASSRSKSLPIPPSIV